MIEKDTTYTDSALSDVFKKFMSHYKKDGQYKYLDMIDIALLKKSIIFDVDDIFNYEGISDEFLPLHKMIIHSPKRAISEASRAATEIFRQKDADATEKISVGFSESKITASISNVLGDRYIGKMVTVEGMITAFGEKHNFASEREFKCEGEHKIKILQDKTIDVKIPIICENKHCKSRVFIDVTPTENYEQIRKISVKSFANDSLRDSEIGVILTNSLVDDIPDIGNNIRVTGYVIPVGLESKGRLSGYSINIVESSSIVKKDEIDNTLTDSDIEQFKELVTEDNFYNTITNSIAPSIYGNKPIKESILLMLARSPNTYQNDGTMTRGWFNVSVFGDPGVAKTKLQEWVSNDIPKWEFILSKQMTEAGLLFGVDETKDAGRIVKAGAMILNSGGGVTIDEYPKANQTIRDSLFGPMENGLISMTKIKSAAKTQVETSVFASGNPIEDIWNDALSLSDNLGINPAELQRFDFIWIVKDEVNDENDRKIAESMLRGTSGIIDESNGSLDAFTLVKYIKYVQRFNPILTRELEDHIIDTFIEMRAQKQKISGYRESPRIINVLRRTTLSIARLHQRTEANFTDLQKAIKLIKSMISQRGIDISEANTYTSKYAKQILEILKLNHIESFGPTQLFTMINDNDETFVKIFGDIDDISTNKKWRNVVGKVQSFGEVLIDGQKPLRLRYDVSKMDGSTQ